jgi:inorganic pyrophosphatase
MVDAGEMDWKVVAIDNTDPDAKRLNDIEDVRMLVLQF